MIRADPLGSHRSQGHTTLGALPRLRLAHPRMLGAFEIFDGSNNILFRLFLKLGQAATTAKDVFISFIKGSEFTIGWHTLAANRVQEEERRQVFIRVFLEFGQTVIAAEGVIPPLVGSSK